MDDPLTAVITADVVNSTHFSPEETGSRLRKLISILSSDFEWVLKPEIYRGDSFQGVLRHPEDTLHLAILSRALMRAHEGGKSETDIRIAIGIGKVAEMTDRPGTSDGEAFRLSGRLADTMKQRKARIAVALPAPSRPLDAVLDLLETLVEKWTPSQSEVIAGLLRNETISQIAERVSVSQPAVSQRVAAAKWWAIEHLLTTFPEHLKLYSAV